MIKHFKKVFNMKEGDQNVKTKRYDIRIARHNEVLIKEICKSVES